MKTMMIIGVLIGSVLAQGAGQPHLQSVSVPSGCLFYYRTIPEERIEALITLLKDPRERTFVMQNMTQFVRRAATLIKGRDASKGARKREGWILLKAIHYYLCELREGDRYWSYVQRANEGKSGEYLRQVLTHMETTIAVYPEVSALFSRSDRSEFSQLLDSVFPSDQSERMVTD